MAPAVRGIMMAQATERKSGARPFHCPDCGSTAVQGQAWIDVNTQELLDVQDGESFWCVGCSDSDWEGEQKRLCECDDPSSHLCSYRALVNGQVQRCSVAHAYHEWSLSYAARHGLCGPQLSAAHVLIPPDDLWGDACLAPDDEDADGEGDPKTESEGYGCPHMAESGHCRHCEDDADQEDDA